MKFLFLLSVFLMYCSTSMALPPLPMLPPELPAPTPAPAITAPAAAAPTSVQTMDANLENDMLNRIASLLYSTVDARVYALNQLQNQAKNLYISPTVQYNYYTAIYRIYSDLLGTTKVENIIIIRKFVDLLKKVISSPIMDANQKAQTNSMAPQLMQKLSDLSKPVQKTIAKTPAGTAPKTSATTTRGARVR